MWRIGAIRPERDPRKQTSSPGGLATDRRGSYPNQSMGAKRTVWPPTVAAAMKPPLTWMKTAMPRV